MSLEEPGDRIDPSWDFSLCKVPTPSAMNAQQRTRRTELVTLLVKSFGLKELDKAPGHLAQLSGAFMGSGTSSRRGSDDAHANREGP